MSDLFSSWGQYSQLPVKLSVILLKVTVSFPTVFAVRSLLAFVVVTTVLATLLIRQFSYIYSQLYYEKLVLSQQLMLST